MAGDRVSLAFAWWWLAVGLAALGLALAFKPAQGPLWPFLLLLPMALITALLALAAMPAGSAWIASVAADTIFQVLLAVRLVCAILMAALASGRRIVAIPLALAALLADPLSFNYAACTFGAPICH